MRIRSALIALVLAVGSALLPATAYASAPLPGADFSWPACKKGPKHLPLPSTPFSFAVVGLNDGEPGNTSACLDRTLAFAAKAAGRTDQPRLSFYVMAAWPWSPFELRGVPHPSWPRSTTFDGHRVRVPKTYGSICHGGHLDATCAYVFGWATAFRDAHLRGVTDARHRTWWIDVEGPRDWSSRTLLNQAIVEGMHAYFTASPRVGGLGARSGLYSTGTQWNTIIGRLRPASPLAGVDDWVSIGRSTLAAARRYRRSGAPFTPGSRVRMVQYWDHRGVDRDVTG